jgi:hypothetical protein
LAAILLRSNQKGQDCGDVDQQRDDCKSDGILAHPSIVWPLTALVAVMKFNTAVEQAFFSVVMQTFVHG